MLQISEQDAKWVAGEIIEYFNQFTRIDDYMRSKKLEIVQNTPPALPGMGLENDLFSDFTMSPMDMDFRIETVSIPDFMRYLNTTSSHINEASIPGKNLLWLVWERNTNKLVGMVRFGSPTINSRPRNLYLGKPLDTYNEEVMSRFNASAIMGFVIVPTQPFGYNYLGGKLLAGLCCSHYAREQINEKYGTNICLFETTSLYGSTKSASQYDGMRPFLRHIGLTDSKFTPLLNDETYHLLNNQFIEWNGGEQLVSDDASSKKLKRQTKIIAITKNALKNSDPILYDSFCKVIENATNMTEQKRTYISTYGYENVAQYLNLETDTLIKKENFDRFELDSIVDWWKKKATRRHQTLKEENRLRTELEVWSDESTDLEIIR